MGLYMIEKYIIIFGKLLYNSNSIIFNSLYLALKSYDIYNKNNIRLGAPEETLYGLVS